ncbi:hypothetical protein V8087_003740 [Vibrio vulnificus]|nr:hypothetical protein [Vibrio vulnificus]EME0077306.1 hypothetical protein [Vibrio vulnificus]
MYKLLIERGMDNFTVVEARDALLSMTDTFSCGDAARKILYRQMYQFEKKGWLVCTGHNRKKRYLKTDVFKELSIQRKSIKCKEKQGKDYVYVGITSIKKRAIDQALLLKEKSDYEGELAMLLSEVEEYRSLKQRFPEQDKLLTSILKKAKDRSTSLLGKINALSNVLKSLAEEAAQQQRKAM